MMRDLLKSIVDVRNHITHQGRHVLEEELRAFAAVTADLAGRVIVSKEGEPFRPSAEVGEIASKIGCELRTMGLGLFSSYSV